MSDTEFLLSIPFAPTLMVFVIYTLFRPIAKGDIVLGHHLHKLILPFSRKRTTSVGFLAIVCDCYLILLLDLIGYVSGFRITFGIYSFNLLCCGIFLSALFLFMTVYLIYMAIQVRATSFISSIIYIAFACMLAVLLCKVFLGCLRIIEDTEIGMAFLPYI